jgi:4-diphosphocytidyl-2-C-methyl-D-erythritol kinase
MTSPDEAGLSVRVPAKLNLTLDVGARRADGYHEIETIMQCIDLYDRLDLTVGAGEGVTVDTSDPKLPRDHENLAGQAALAFLDAAGGRNRVDIHIHKRIPAGAGLGGGSADAAAVLSGLNRLFGGPLGAGALARLAATLGSDVPFFLAGGTCLCTGRGERIRRLPPLPACTFVVAVPALAVSAGWAYAAFDSRPHAQRPRRSRSAVEAIRQGDCAVLAATLANDLEPAVLACFEEIEAARRALLAAGAMVARMTGSGAGVFGMFSESPSARAAAGRLAGAGLQIFVARPVAGGPERVD